MYRPSLSSVTRCFETHAKALATYNREKGDLKYMLMFFKIRNKLGINIINK